MRRAAATLLVLLLLLASSLAQPPPTPTERVTDPGQVAHALVNGINATKEGKPVLLEFITTRDKIRSEPRRGGGYGNEVPAATARPTGA